MEATKATQGRSHFSGINRRPGDRGKNVDRGGEGRGGYAALDCINVICFFLGGGGEGYPLIY